MNLLWIAVSVFLALIALVTIIDLVLHGDRGGGWAIAGWCVLIVVLPVIGSVIYWATRRTSPEEVEAQRLAEASLRHDTAHRF